MMRDLVDLDAMDPYKLGTYNDRDEDEGLPIIRVVAALAYKVL